ncbi:MAG: hypothetical protein ABI690_02815 [Chloroflexota bacterium]
MASMAAAEACIKSAVLSRLSAVGSSESEVSPQRQITPVFPPRLCQLGGAPRPSRRFSAYKIRHSAALLVLPALDDGDNFRPSAF